MTDDEKKALERWERRRARLLSDVWDYDRRIADLKRKVEERKQAKVAALVASQLALVERLKQ